MFILQRDDDDTCMHGNAGCLPSFAIIGPNPSEKDDSQTESNGPSHYESPGPHRFIGIAAVAGLALLTLVAYFVFGRRPRQVRRKYCRCLGGGDDDEVAVDEGKMNTKQVAVILESASASSAEEMTHRHSRQISNYGNATDTDRRSKSRKPSSGRRGRRSSAGLAGEGAVAEGKDVDVESGVLVTGWEVQDVRGVRYDEFHTPTDHQPEQRRQVDIQKPCLAYISGNDR